MAKQKNIFKDAEPIWKYIKGTGNWNTIIKPDDYDKWSVNLSGQEVEDLEVELQAALDEAEKFAKSKGKNVEKVASPYAEYNGTKYIQFKKPKYDDDTEGPKLYNITGEEVTGQVKKDPGGGSTLRLRVMFKPYYMAATKTVGLSKKLLAVQIIDNKEYVGASGFEDESGGAETPPFEVETTEDY